MDHTDADMALQLAFWAKSDSKDTRRYHPVISHLIDVACVARLVSWLRCAWTLCRVGGYRWESCIITHSPFSRATLRAAPSPHCNLTLSWTES